MDYNKKILLNLKKIYFLNIFINKIIIDNKYSIEYIHKYIKYYNKILKILNRIIVNSKILFKDIKNIERSHNCIMEIIPPKELKIYEYKIINKKIDTTSVKYENIDGLDIIIYRKKTKIKDSLFFLIYQSSFLGLKKQRVYNISKNLELLNYEFYIYIYNIFYNNNIYYTRGFLTYEKNESYKLEKLYLLFKNNEMIKEKLIYKYLFIYDFQNNIMNININNDIISRLAYTSSANDYINYIDEKYHYIYLNYKRKKLINKNIYNNKIILYCNNNNIIIKKIYPMLYYYIDDCVYVYIKNNKLKIFNLKINILNSINIDIENLFIYNYKIYITNSDFIKILIKFNMINKSNKDILNMLKIDYINESIENGFDKIINYKHIFDDTYIRNETPYNILNSVYDLSKLNIEQFVFYNIKYDNFYSIQESYNHVLKMYNSIYKFLNKK